MEDDVNPLKCSEKKRLAILAAGKDLFLREGSIAVSVDTIAALAEVSKKTVYNHFATKVELFEEVVRQHWLDLFSQEKLILLDEEKPIKGELTKFSASFLDFAYHPQTIALFRVLIHESAQSNNLAEKLLVDGKAPFTYRLSEFLQFHVRKKNLIGMDTDLAASFLIGLLKEPHYWPMMMGFTTEQLSTAKKKKLISEAVTSFLRAYLLS